MLLSNCSTYTALDCVARAVVTQVCKGRRTIVKRDSDQLSMLLSKSKSCTGAWLLH
jgi:hypothetical protein